MLYLITGANGAGKTLNTLKWVHDRATKENRPVCHNGRFEAVEGGPLTSWKHVEFKDWQQQQDGTIFVVDECHNDLPLRASSSAVPEPVRMLAEHRRRGMDFYLITQHPQNIDNFVRRLIGSPGWHRHLKRAFGADMVSVLEWSAVNPNCEKHGAGNSAEVKMQAFPKEVYSWYRSASLHTAKRAIPRKLWIALAAFVLCPALLWLGVSQVYTKVTKDAPAVAEKVEPTYEKRGPGSRSAGEANVQKVLTVEDYIAMHSPRIVGLPHTAPRYDEVTRPNTAPVPAACVAMKSVGCRCYTQQGTLISGMEKATCEQIVANGFFVDFDAAGRAQRNERPVNRTDES